MRFIGFYQRQAWCNAVPVIYPIGQEHEHRGVIDLITMKALTYKDVADAGLTEGEIPSDLLEVAKKYRTDLLERACEFDDEALAKFLEGQEIDEVTLKKAIRKGVISGKLFPIFGGDNRTAEAQLLLNGVVEYLPSPNDLPPVEGIDQKTGEKTTRERKNEAPFSGLAFKIMTDPHVGRLVYVRVYSGKLSAGQQVYNSTKQKYERIGKLILLHADQRELIEEAYAGEIVAVVGIKDTSMGTPCVILITNNLESISFRNLLFHWPLNLQPRATRRKWDWHGKLSDEDPTFRIKSNLKWPNHY